MQCLHHQADLPSYSMPPRILFAQLSILGWPNLLNKFEEKHRLRAMRPTVWTCMNKFYHRPSLMGSNIAAPRRTRCKLDAALYADVTHEKGELHLTSKHVPQRPDCYLSWRQPGGGAHAHWACMSMSSVCRASLVRCMRCHTSDEAGVNAEEVKNLLEVPAQI